VANGGRVRGPWSCCDTPVLRIAAVGIRSPSKSQSTPALLRMTVVDLTSLAPAARWSGMNCGAVSPTHSTGDIDNSTRYSSTFVIDAIDV
jgi:hypothetical protein